jgi:NAD(P)-dependent dehydrogenase (short-subunit alcohol dehydrogenase family)
VLAVQADMADVDALAAILLATQQRFGPPTILVNNAGTTDQATGKARGEEADQRSTVSMTVRRCLITRSRSTSRQWCAVESGNGQSPAGGARSRGGEPSLDILDVASAAGDGEGSAAATAATATAHLAHHLAQPGASNGGDVQRSTGGRRLAFWMIGAMSGSPRYFMKLIGLAFTSAYAAATLGFFIASCKTKIVQR